METPGREISCPKPEKRPKISSTLLIYVCYTNDVLVEQYNLFTEALFSVLIVDGLDDPEFLRYGGLLKLLTSTWPREGPQLRFRLKTDISFDELGLGEFIIRSSGYAEDHCKV